MILNIMDCNTLKIWLTNASDNELVVFPQEVEDHLKSCSSCTLKVDFIRHSIAELQLQKKFKLPEFNSHLILSALEKQVQNQSVNNSFNKSQIGKLAIAAVITGGLILGIIAGNLPYTSSSSETSLWDNEFVIISDNSTNTINIFE
jgi:hypothetical protein